VPGVAETWTGVPAGEAKPRLHFPQVAGAAASSSPACCVRVAGRHRHVAVTGKVPGGGADSSHRLAGGCGTGSMNGLHGLLEVPAGGRIGPGIFPENQVHGEAA